MAYTLTNLRDDIRNYTEVGSNVLTDAVLETIIINDWLVIPPDDSVGRCDAYNTHKLDCNGTPVKIAVLLTIKHICLSLRT